jgi:hypothetical protein
MTLTFFKVLVCRSPASSRHGLDDSRNLSSTRQIVLRIQFVHPVPELIILGVNGVILDVAMAAPISWSSMPLRLRDEGV